MGQDKQYGIAIKDWPIDERPREKLLKRGEHLLSNTELMAILLRSGIKGQSALDLARRIFNKFKTFRSMSHTDIADWKQFKGVGQAKIAQIKAAIEIGRRFREEQIRESNPQIKSSKDIAELFMPRMRDLKKEVFKVALLNARNKIIEIVEVTEGTVNQANPIIREIFQKAIQCFASSIICVHNHPSGDARPSPEDKIFTKKLVQAGEVLYLKVLDHIVIGNDTYFSFVDEHLI
ncbi:MAG: DNA repair protein RadC [Candidatus Omnitrophota bacterium]